MGEDTAAEKPYWVYMLACSDGSLYTGVSTDVERRARQHSAGTGAKYTRSRLPVKVVYTELCAGKSQALRREYAIKRLSHREKLALIAGQKKA